MFFSANDGGGNVGRELWITNGTPGGTSLVNANVAIVPESDVFRLAGWPASLSLDTLRPYYDRARQVLAAAPHPNARRLAKVQTLDRRAREIGAEAFPLDIAVNFTVTGANSYGAEQKPCTRLR